MASSNVARDLLGVTKRAEKGDFPMDLDLARKPLQYEGSVVRVFCTACGNTQELTQEAAVDLAQQAGAQAPISWESRYFCCKDGCLACDQNHLGVSLEEIPAA